MNRIILILYLSMANFYSYAQDVQKNQDELTMINQAIEKEPKNPVNYYYKSQYYSRGLEWSEISIKSKICINYNKAFKLLSSLEKNGALTKEQDEIYVFLLDVWNAGYCDFN